MMPSQKFGTERPQSESAVGQQIPDRVAADGREDPGGNGDGRAATSRDRQASSIVIGSLLRDGPHHRLARADGLAEVAAQGQADPAQVLERGSGR